MVDVTSDENIIKANLIDTSEPIKANLVKTAEPIQATPTTTPSATEEVKGIIRIATEEEAIEGMSRNTAITPFTLKICTDTYTYEQGIASNTWVINHNLNKRPSIIVVDTLDRVQVPDDIYYNSDNTMTVMFLAAFAGKAYLN